MTNETLSVAEDMLRGYFERWQRLEDEKRTVADDLKELFAEMKGNGFNTKVARAVFREEVGDKAEQDEFEAICDLYRAALAKPRAGRAPDAHGNITQFPPRAEQKSPSGERPVEAADQGHPSADHVKPPASQAAPGSGSANMENGDVESGASRAGVVDRNASLAAREGEKPLHPNSPDPRNPGADDGQRSIPSDPAEGAKIDAVQAVSPVGVAARQVGVSLNGSQAVPNPPIVPAAIPPAVTTAGAATSSPRAPATLLPTVLP